MRHFLILRRPVQCRLVIPVLRIYVYTERDADGTLVRYDVPVQRGPAYVVLRVRVTAAVVDIYYIGRVARRCYMQRRRVLGIASLHIRIMLV